MQNDNSSSTTRKTLLFLSPYKFPYQGAVALSFDFETSATYGNFSSLSTSIRRRLFSLAAKVTKKQADLSFHYGLGYAMRAGTANIIETLLKTGFHATWFATGHALLSGNRQRNAYRINQRLPYATPAAGFTDITAWRRNYPTFHHEPFSDYREDPYWYFGDLSRRLHELGEDIQCHTFSHPYIALEPVENIRIDIEDWQRAAESNGLSKAAVFSFPFGGDAYRCYADLRLDAMIGKEIPGAPYTVVPLSRAAIDILRENGIELLTRCASKYGACSIFDRYNVSNLFFMSDREFIPERESIESLDGVISDIAEARAAVNLWMHPCDVFSALQQRKFHELAARLATAADTKNIWLCTIAEIWHYYKSVRNCELNLTRAGGNLFEIAVKNKNPDKIENLLVASRASAPSLAGQNNNISVCPAGLVIKILNPGETLRFRSKLAGDERVRHA